MVGLIVSWLVWIWRWMWSVYVLVVMGDVGVSVWFGGLVGVICGCACFWFIAWFTWLCVISVLVCVFSAVC